MPQHPTSYQKVFGARTGQGVPSLEAQGLVALELGFPKGFNALSPRYELRWVAGAQGLPQLNAVTDPTAGDTYDTSDLTALLLADRHFEILGNNATSDDVTIYAEGGIQLQTDGGGTDAVILLPHLNSGQSPWTTITWGTDKQTHWSADISTAAALGTGGATYAGLKLTNTDVIATDADQVFFRYDSAEHGGSWAFVYSIGGTDTEVDTGIDVAVSTRYRFRIEIAADRTARGYIATGVSGDYRLVGTSTALTDAIDLIPYIGILEGAAAARTLYVHGQTISRVIG